MVLANRSRERCKDFQCYLLDLAASDPEHLYFLTDPPHTLEAEFIYLSRHFEKRVRGFQDYGARRAVAAAR